MPVAWESLNFPCVGYFPSVGVCSCRVYCNSCGGLQVAGDVDQTVVSVVVSFLVICCA
jgi:hypothetical protein